MTTDQKASVLEIAQHYTKEKQTAQAIEELGELIQALGRAQNGKVNNASEEIADVQIMLEQLIYLLDIKADVSYWIDFKIKRQFERISGKK